MKKLCSRFILLEVEVWSFSRDAFETVYADDVFSCSQLWKRQYQVSAGSWLLGMGSTKTSTRQTLKRNVMYDSKQALTVLISSRNRLRYDSRWVSNNLNGWRDCSSIWCRSNYRDYSLLIEFEGVFGEIIWKSIKPESELFIPSLESLNTTVSLRLSGCVDIKLFQAIFWVDCSMSASCARKVA